MKQSLSTADLRIALEAVGVRAMSIYERSELIDAAMSAGIAKLDNGNIVLEPRTSRPASSPLTAGGRGVVIPEPLEVGAIARGIDPGWVLIYYCAGGGISRTY